VYGLIEPRSRLQPFFIEYRSIYLHGDILPKEIDEPPEVLFLHGGGDEGRRGFLLLRHLLLEQHGISSCAFDFFEYSRTGWESCPADSDSQEQVNQASGIIDACFDSQPFSIVASDLSAGVALQLEQSFPVRQLVLLNPSDDQDVTGSTPCQRVAIPVESAQTLVYMNNNPALLLKIARLVKDTLQGDGSRVRCNYKEVSS
jgi:pimeloyl-ACP methyl ester carboxylesterase